jgi:hypothetical protein
MPSHPTPHSCPTPLPSTHAPPTPHHACVCIFMCVCKGGREGSLGLDSNEGGVDVDVDDDGERNAVTPAHQGSHLGTPGRTPGHRTRALNPGHQQGEHLGTKATQAHTRGGHSGGGLKGACACGGNDGCRGIRGVGRAQKAVHCHTVQVQRQSRSQYNLGGQQAPAIHLSHTWWHA